jgi:hypothetical protein
MNEQEQQIRIAIVDDHEMFRCSRISTSSDKRPMSRDRWR